MNKLILRWKDEQGNEQSKEYQANQSTEAEKARRWLANNGAVDIDLSFKRSKKTAPQSDQPEEPR